MIGIYKITNKINNKIYIGQSKNIEQRWKEHVRHSKDKYSRNKPYIHSAINKYGKDNFKFEVLEECKFEELDEREKYYIAEYKSNVKGIGYNSTPGGDARYNIVLRGVDNPVSVFSEDEVFYIRDLYADKNTTLSEAYNLFCSRYKNISINTFKCVWYGRSYKEIHYDVYTEENRKMNKDLSLRKRDITKHSRVVDLNDVLEIRNFKKEGIKRRLVYSKYSFYNKNTFDDIWYYNTFKNIIP